MIEETKAQGGLQLRRRRRRRRRSRRRRRCRRRRRRKSRSRSRTRRKRRRRRSRRKRKRRRSKIRRRIRRRGNRRWRRFTDIRLVVTSSLFWNVMQRRFVVTDVSGQPIGPIINGQAVQDACRNTGAPLYREWRGL
jgi:hypothetical protein